MMTLDRQICDEKEGWLKSKLVQMKQYLAGANNWKYYLWHVLMLQSWLREQGLMMRFGGIYG